MADRLPNVSSVQDWERDLRGMSAQQAADCIIADMFGFRRTEHHGEDAVNLAHALEAYAKLKNVSAE